ncbi:branched-chain amino acid transaminase [Roseisolibacter sp. H3M3-2]|uniref:branched-chain amino acid transaminase n=1 Tax=Roseisolibacter sp. H3M3-2 TaxID=3031323 RepID=UPI0023DB6B86|nr:branched-chain amino acid transaminase [Roseisolibacter sp. H3M3-2]MDF1502804.1 branched-chain amino acid transaminase [Roseisolibacter sp. H3M3-2]
MSDRPSSGRTSVIWRDGQLIPWEQATLHVMSHVVHYGSSVFEGVRCYETPTGPAVFRLREHMRRLVDSCKIYRIELPWTVDQLVAATVDTVAANDLRSCYLRPLVVRAGEQMGVLPFGAPIETFIIAWKWGAYLGHDALENGVDVGVSSWRRAAPGSFPALAKAGGNYLNSQLVKMQARTDGYVEGITLDNQGHVAEGSGENLFVIRDGVVYTSGLDAAILNGITRDSVIRIAQDLGYEVRQERMPREMLYVADELFFTGTAAELTPIRSVDRIPVGEGKPGPITRAIQERYMGIATGRIADPYGWLTPVPVAEPVG